MTTLGRYRHLQQCSTPAGHFVILAVDHRGNLQAELNRQRSEPISDADFIAFKAQILKHLTPPASAVLTDPTYGFAPGIAGSYLPANIGLLSPLEVTDYSIHPSRRALKFIPNWSVEKIKRVGAAGVKLLIYYHPAADNLRALQVLVEKVLDDCRRFDIPLFLEPIAYSLDEHTPLHSSQLQEIVIEAGRVFSRMGVDVLKLQFPCDPKDEPNEDVWRTALNQLDSVCMCPWALLSGGVDFATFARQAELACEAGASGVIAGRAIWADAIAMQGKEREIFLATTAKQRLDELRLICSLKARDWRKRVRTPNVPLNWHETYDA